MNANFIKKNIWLNYSISQKNKLDGIIEDLGKLKNGKNLKQSKHAIRIKHIQKVLLFTCCTILRIEYFFFI